jgi:hypothetical protein
MAFTKSRLVIGLIRGSQQSLLKENRSCTWFSIVTVEEESKDGKTAKDDILTGR